MAVVNQCVEKAEADIYDLYKVRLQTQPTVPSLSEHGFVIGMLLGDVLAGDV